MSDKWDGRFMHLAKVIASWSKDPNSQVGCVIVDSDKNVLSGGYNGFPRGVKDDERLHNRNAKLRIIVHAEANAVATAARNGHSLKSGTAYITRHPCGQCSALLIQAGIERIVYYSPAQATEYDSTRWIDEYKAAMEILVEAGIELEPDSGVVSDEQNQEEQKQDPALVNQYRYFKLRAWLIATRWAAPDNDEFDAFVDKLHPTDQLLNRENEDKLRGTTKR